MSAKAFDFFEDSSKKSAANFFEEAPDKQQPSSFDFFAETPQPASQAQKPGFWNNFGQAMAYQMKSGGPSGAPSVSPEQARRVATDVTAQQAISGVFAPLKYLSSLAPYAPRAISFIAGLAESASIGAGVPTARAIAEGKELPSKEEMLKEGALWAGIDLALQAAHLGTSFGSTVNKLSKETGLKRTEVVSRIWNGAKNYYGWSKPKIDPETGAAIIMPEQIEAMTNLANREPEVIVGKTSPQSLESTIEPSPDLGSLRNKDSASKGKRSDRLLRPCI